ncbi:hypothetical protein [Amycolatopsis sp. PS_44_ISF1]|nr:hypothetical protein [Amycolatopsis sp. PS_44_ISF1]MDT8910040.1 hypothetical protein [Amycolatopsis sp. PS_44_ISF1]
MAISKSACAGLAAARPVCSWASVRRAGSSAVTVSRRTCAVE